MIVSDVKDFIAGLKPSQRLLGIDHGEKNIGIALSDTRRKIATPHKTLYSKGVRQDAQAIVYLIEEFDIGGVVIGFPLHMNGTEGERCQAVRTYARELCLVDSTPIFFWDERLSTKAVTDFMIDGDLSRKKRQKMVDKVAASLILQSVLDHLALYEE